MSHEYSVQSELDADEWDAEFRRKQGKKVMSTATKASAGAMRAACQPRNIGPHEQAVLFQFVIGGRLPEWAQNDPRKVFARLMNKSQKWANAAYQRAYHSGWLDKVKEGQ